MSNTQEPFTIEQFYKNLTQGKLLTAKCQKCGKTHLPPRPLCNQCYSTQFEWQPLSTKGKLLTYTIIHIAPTQFQNQTPYAIGIIELDDGLKIPGLIQDVSHEQIKIGMTLNVNLNTNNNTPDNWPQWPKYSLKP